MAGQFSNAVGGTVVAGETLSIHSADALINQGQIAAEQELSLSAAGVMILAGTTQASEGTLTLQTDVGLDNTGTSGGRKVNVVAATMHN
ncbi:hypothetical protein P3G55_27165, partial [Leptospira sp. 96542]|nr:hypothetical protein [Leptospira sp. 96542]